MYLVKPSDRWNSRSYKNKNCIRSFMNSALVNFQQPVSTHCYDDSRQLTQKSLFANFNSGFARVKVNNSRCGSDLDSMLDFREVTTCSESEESQLDFKFLQQVAATPALHIRIFVRRYLTLHQIWTTCCPISFIIYYRNWLCTENPEFNEFG